MTETERRALLITLLARLEKHKRIGAVGPKTYYIVWWEHIEQTIIEMSREEP